MEREGRSSSFVPDVAGSYWVQLVVTDSKGLVSKASTLEIQVDCGAAQPIATLSPPEADAVVGDGFALVATVADADNAKECGGSQTFTTLWAFSALPNGSQAVISNPTALTTSFVPDLAGTYEITFLVTDSTGQSSIPKTLAVEASAPACGEHVPVASASLVAPAAVGSCGNSTLNINLAGNNDRIQLDAAASSDGDNAGTCDEGQLLTYSWTLLRTPFDGDAGCGGGGCLSTQVYPGSGQTAILRTPEAGNYQLRLLVSDSTGRTSEELICSINVSNPG